MLYVKAFITNQVALKVDLYEDEIFTSCPTCGKELQVEPDDLASILVSGATFAGIKIYCKECLCSGRERRDKNA